MKITSSITELCLAVFVITPIVLAGGSTTDDGGYSTGGGCPDDACQPWESPGGSSEEYEFEFPDNPPMPEGADAEWVSGTNVMEDDGSSPSSAPVDSNDENLPETQGEGGDSATATVEHHLDGFSDEDGNSLDSGVFEGDCIELFARRRARYTVKAYYYSCPEEKGFFSQFVGHAVGCPLEESAPLLAYTVSEYRYRWYVTCVTEICPTCD